MLEAWEAKESSRGPKGKGGSGLRMAAPLLHPRDHFV